MLAAALSGKQRSDKKTGSKQTSSQLLEKTGTSRSKLAASFLKRAGTSRHRASWQPTFAKQLQKTGTPLSKLAASSFEKLAHKQASSQLFQKTGTPLSKLAASSFKNWHTTEQAGRQLSHGSQQASWQPTLSKKTARKGTLSKSGRAIKSSTRASQAWPEWKAATSRPAPSSPAPCKP